MKRVSFRIIEKIKNVILVVLVCTTILLLYFLWGNASLEDFMFLEEGTHYEKLATEDVIVPKQIIICMGNDNHTIAEGDMTSIVDVFRSFSTEGNLLIEEITKDKYQAVMEYPSIRATFGYNIDFDGFCERYEINQSLGFDNIGTITEIGFSEGSPASTFIYDGEKKKYFRMVGNDTKNNFTAFEYITESGDNATYYPLKAYLGEESINDTLIPVELPTALNAVPYQQDFEIDQKDTIGDFAKTFFGESFDFVRKVEESDGTVIYMYGYGQKVLIISPDGTVEYKEESKTSSTNQLSFFNALETSLNFIAVHGGFKTVSGNAIKPYLTDVTSITGEKQGFRFVFSFLVNENKLFYAKKNPLILEVVDGQVSYFRRDFIEVGDTSVNEGVNAQREAVSAINMLALNFGDVRDTLVTEGIIQKELQNQISFEQVANKIDNLYFGYYKPPAESELQELMPAWIVEIDGIRLYMDLYEANWLGYSKEYN
jgi:regulatory protein YycH of two-component signal transduction system YycFG